MENTIQLIKEFFEKNKWKYEYVEDKNVFISSINMNGIIGVLRIYIFVRDTDYRVYAVLNSNAEESAYSRVAEYLHRANYGLHNGNFELDYRDGEIRYKTYVSFEGATLSPSVVEDSIFMTIFMFEKYGKNLFRAMLGSEDPEVLVLDAEKPSADDTGEE